MVERVRRADRRLLIALGVLLVAGLVALTSASAPLGYAKFDDTYFFIKRQILFGVIPGLFLFLILARMDYRRWIVYAWPVYGLALLLLVLVFVPGIGVTINHSRSWLSIVGYNVQPAEFAKMSLIIMAAALIARHNKNWQDWQSSLLPVLAVLAPTLLLVMLQPDIGTLSILVMVIFIMLYVAPLPRLYLAILGLLGVIFFISLIIIAPYRVRRLTTFLHPELDPKGVGYQINQAFLAVGSGGVWGVGLGRSRQKFQYLPEVNADSIYAVVAEENGFVISVSLVALILFIGWRGFKIAAAAPDDFGRLVGTGIMTWFLWQSFLNIGAMVGALPLTGVPLPFVSHGGSALLSMLGAMGIIVNISKVSGSTARFLTRH